MSGAWILRAAGVAAVAENDRVALLVTERIEQPPVILTGPGARMWRAIESGADPNDLAILLAQECKTTADDSADIVAGFLDQLESFGLINPIGASQDQTES